MDILKKENKEGRQTDGLKLLDGRGITMPDGRSREEDDLEEEAGVLT